MNLRTIAILIFLSAASHGQDRNLSTGDEHLLAAIDRLRTKTIYEAYFVLTSPSVPRDTFFAPDTKGNAFLIIEKERTLPKETFIDLKTFNQAYDKKYASVFLLPTFDETNQRIIFYSDDSWSRFIKIAQPYLVSQNKIEDILSAVDINKESKLLIIKIPKDNQSTFLREIIEKGWGIPLKNFRYEVGWN